MSIVCGRITFLDSKLTASVNHRAGYSLLETVAIFKEYFEKKYPGKPFSKIEIFLSESDMHSGKKPWQTTWFNEKGGEKVEAEDKRQKGGEK